MAKRVSIKRRAQLLLDQLVDVGAADDPEALEAELTACVEAYIRAPLEELETYLQRRQLALLEASRLTSPQQAAWQLKESRVALDKVRALIGRRPARAAGGESRSKRRR